MRLAAAPCICTALLLLACGDSEGGRGDSAGTTVPITASGGITVSGSASAGTDGATDGATSSVSSDTPATSTPNPAETGDDGLKFDIGGETGIVPPDDSGEPAEGCKKIDFLFVVDNSGSMEDEQQSLANSFDGFITSIQDTVMAEDYHIMVIDTDAGSAFLQECFVICSILNTCEGYPCNMLPVPEGCDAALGSGLIDNPQGDACGIAGAKRYMVDGQPNLAQTFSCLAKVGTNGDGSERPMEAMIQSIDALNDPGDCNDGFLRDDALLVVTFITDEEDDEESKGNPAGWNAALVAAKKGAEKNIVVLGLIGDNDQPNAVCTEGLAEPSPRLRMFAESFTFGSWASICTLDYAPFFDQAVGKIDTACQQFEPPG